MTNEKSNVILHVENEEAKNELRRFVRQNDVKIAREEKDLPIDFDVEGLEFETTTEDVDFEKCNAAAYEILDTIKTFELNFFETVAVLQKIHTKIDPEGGDVLNDK